MKHTMLTTDTLTRFENCVDSKALTDDTDPRYRAPVAEEPQQAEEAPKASQTPSGKTFADLRQAIEKEPARSAWGRGKKEYALELLHDLEEAAGGGHFNLDDWNTPRALRAALLNGADDWTQYSFGGCSLIYDADIAKRLCPPSELKRRKGGDLPPNSREEWLDVQARALFQAANLIYRLGR